MASNEADSTVINGEKIRVNIKAFYDNPPERLSNLYPVAWVQGPKELPTTAWGKPATVRNYKAGMAKAWLLKPYQQVFPDISSGDGKTTTEVPRYARVLTQSWGSAAFAFPMAAVIF